MPAAIQTGKSANLANLKPGNCLYCLNINPSKFSETRFIEAMEHVCKKFDSENSGQWDSLKDLQFKVMSIIYFQSFAFQCNHLAEDSEELLEKWFFKRQESDPDLYKYLCIDQLKRCCEVGHHGPNCSPCPGALIGPACFGNGKCDVSYFRINFDLLYVIGRRNTRRNG